MSVGGSTRTVFVVADPVAQVRTPQALNKIWAERESDIVTVPSLVTSTDLRQFLAGLRANGSAAGAVVSVPHKQAVVELCDELGAGARIVGAVNAIKRTPNGRLVGDTFDGVGFVRGLRAKQIDPEGRRVRVIGAGGAASAIAVALAESGVASIQIENRTEARAAALAARIRDKVGFAMATSVGETGRETADLIVNATSMGMRPNDVADFEFGSLAEGCIAADVIVSDRLTPFLEVAASHGLATHDGRNMLDGQMQLIADFLVS